MPSPRKHPSLYSRDITDLFYGPSPGVTVETWIELLAPNRARNFRNQLYAFRESLRTHPTYNPELLKILNATKLSIHDGTLRIINIGA